MWVLPVDPPLPRARSAARAVGVAPSTVTHNNPQGSIVTEICRQAYGYVVRLA